MTIISQAEQQRRTAYTAGLRALADILDAHPELPLPYHGTGPNPQAITFHFLASKDPRAEMAAARRALGVSAAKNAPDTDHGSIYYQLSGKLHGLHFKLTAFREQVCERVVVGTREVEVEEPDPDALAALPKVKRTEVVEDVEWQCHPILTGMQS